MKWMAGLGVLLCVMGLTVPVMNVAGFCASERRFLSNAEIISNVIDDVYSRYPPLRYATVGEYVSNPIPYPSREEFVLANPKCCRLVSESDKGYRPPFIARLRGRAVAFVEIDYWVEKQTVSKAETAGVPPGVKREYHAVTNCGRVWNGI